MAVGPRLRRVASTVLLAFLGSGLVALVWAGPAMADPVPGAATASSSVPAAGLTDAPTPATGASAAAIVSLSITDGVPGAKPGSQHTYQVVVTNQSDVQRQLLLEVSPPAGARVDDAGGGTMNAALIDYGVTAPAGGRVSERFQVTLGPARAGQSRADARASTFVLGGAGSGSAPDAQATDSDAIIGAAPAAGASAAAANGASPASRHTGLWIAALAFGALLVIVGLAVGFWPASRPGRRRAASGRSRRVTASRPDRPGSLGIGVRGLDRSHPGRTARRAAQAATAAGNHNGAHQADRGDRADRADRAERADRARRAQRAQRSAP
jgi:hypothetical protein